LDDIARALDDGGGFWIMVELEGFWMIVVEFWWIFAFIWMR